MKSNQGLEEKTRDRYGDLLNYVYTSLYPLLCLSRARFPCITFAYIIDRIEDRILILPIRSDFLYTLAHPNNGM